MRKDVFWNSLGTMAWAFLSPLLLIVVTRLNGLADSGIFSFAFALALIMFTIACYGGRTYQVSDHKQAFSTNGYISLRVITTLAVVGLTVFFILANGYDLRKAVIVLILVGQRVFDAIAEVFYGILQKNNLLHIAGKSLFYKSLLSFVAFLALDIASNDLVIASLALPIVSLMFVIFYDVPKSRQAEAFAVRIRSSETAQMLKATFLPFVVAALGLVFVNIARYFIDIFHPALQGYFGIIVMPLSFITLLFSFMFTPALLQLSNKFNSREFQSLNRLIGKIVGAMLVVTLALAIGTHYLGAAVLQLLFGFNFSAYTPDIVLVVVIGAAVSLTSLFTQIAIIARKLRFAAVVYVGTTLLLIILGIALTQELEIRGALIAYVVASFAQMFIMGGYYLFLVRSQNSPRKS